MENAGV